jgi:hypothetical protein
MSRDVIVDSKMWLRDVPMQTDSRTIHDVMWLRDVPMQTDSRSINDVIVDSKKAGFTDAHVHTRVYTSESAH